MMAYIELIKPEVVIGLTMLVVFFIALGAYAIHSDKKHEQDKHQNHGH